MYKMIITCTIHFVIILYTTRENYAELKVCLAESWHIKIHRLIIAYETEADFERDPVVREGNEFIQIYFKVEIILIYITRRAVALKNIYLFYFFIFCIYTTVYRIRISRLINVNYLMHYNILNLQINILY